MTEDTNIPSPDEWATILREWLSTEAAHDEYAREHWCPAIKLFPNGDSRFPEYVSVTMSALAERYVNTQQRLMATPAPDLEALSHKLDVALRLEEEVEGDDGAPSMIPWGPDYLAQTIADYKRLLRPCA